jgi:hypothetical protein
MNHDLRVLRDDVAFLRELAGEGELRREGAALAAIGAVFACVDLTYWSYSAGYLSLPGSLAYVPWMVGVALIFLSLGLIKGRIPRVPSAAARAIGAASAGVGIGVTTALLSLIAAGFALRQPIVITSLFPVFVLMLYGMAWMVAFAVKRRTWLALVAAGCFVAAFCCGVVAGHPAEWLVLAVSMLLLVAIPGVAMMRLQAR